ncbi:MAG: hypothetical protein J6S23_05485 [Clostridia bacterium]|nr:hypothetical protein [Clostridia bacterium]
MKKRKIAKKSLYKLKRMIKKRHNRRRFSKLQRVIFQCVLFLGWATFINYLVSNTAPFLEQYVPTENESWAVALIALPVAFLGIWLSIYLPCLTKYNSCFANKTLNSIYSKTLHWFDFQSFFVLRFSFDFLLWSVAFFGLMYTKMIAYSFVMAIDLLYLICFTVWKYKQRPCNIYMSNIMKSYFQSISKYSSQQLENINKLINEDKLDEAQKEEKYIHFSFWQEIDELMLSIITDKNNNEEKDAFICIFSELLKLPFQEANGLIIDNYINRAAVIFEHSIDVGDYLYAKKISDLVFEAWYNYLEKICNYLEEYIKHSQNIQENYKYLYLNELEEYVCVETEIGCQFNVIYKIFKLHNSSILTLIKNSKNNVITSEYISNWHTEEAFLCLCALREKQLDKINDALKSNIREVLK